MIMGVQETGSIEMTAPAVRDVIRRQAGMGSLEALVPAVMLGTVQSLVQLALPGPMLAFHLATAVLGVAPADIVKVHIVFELASVHWIQYIRGEGRAVWAQRLPNELHSHWPGMAVLEA